jgi:hypothetical protein
MSRFSNTDGTWLALGAAALLGVAGAARRGSANQNLLRVTSHTGKPYHIRLVREGEGYGASTSRASISGQPRIKWARTHRNTSDAGLLHDLGASADKPPEDPLVEFWWPSTRRGSVQPWGSFTGERYSLSILNGTSRWSRGGGPVVRGMSLQNDPEGRFSAQTMRQIVDWVNAQLRGSANRKTVFKASDFQGDSIEHMADAVGQSWGGFLYLPDEDDLAAIEWARGRYGIGSYLHDKLTHGVDKSIAGRERPEIHITDVNELKKVMWQDDSDRIPSISDYVPIQSLLFLLAPNEVEKNEFELIEAIEQYVSENLEGRAIDAQSLVHGLNRTAAGQRLLRDYGSGYDTLYDVIDYFAAEQGDEWERQARQTLRLASRQDRRLLEQR